MPADGVMFFSSAGVGFMSVVVVFRCLTKGERDERFVVLRSTDVNASIDGALSVSIDTRCHTCAHCANLKSHRKLCQRALGELEWVEKVVRR